MGMTLDEAITRYKNNAEYERAHGLQDCLEFSQLAKWLEELRAYRNMYHADNVDNCLREKVVDNGMPIDEQELAITYLNEMLPTYVEGYGYEAHPVPEYYAIETAIETIHKYQKIEQIVADRKGKLILNTLVAIIKVVENRNDKTNTGSN